MGPAAAARDAEGNILVNSISYTSVRHPKMKATLCVLQHLGGSP